MDNSNYRKIWLEWLNTTTDLSFERSLDPTDLSLNNELECVTNFHEKLNKEDSEGEFSFWTELDVTLSHLYGQNTVKYIFGEYSRWAEKMTCIQMKGKGFFPVIDKNVEHYLNSLKNPHNWVRRLPHFDVSGHYSGQDYFFDVKCHVSPKDMDFKHKLHNLKFNEGIYFMRIYPRPEFRKHGSIGKCESVGYLLYDDLIKLFSLNEDFKNRIPGYFFFNGNIGDLVAYRNEHEYLEVPLLMLEIENGHIPSKVQLEQIARFVNLSKNNDGKYLIESYLQRKLPKKAA